ncbi:hypothetical protein A2U01_0045920, partial [Trifolium medium]|nr:hypothetical protein [Trifolium medium]
VMITDTVMAMTTDTVIMATATDLQFLLMTLQKMSTTTILMNMATTLTIMMKTTQKMHTIILMKITFTITATKVLPNHFSVNQKTSQRRSGT